MQTYELVAPCHFGMEAVLKKEIYDLGYEIVQVEDGKVTFAGDAEALCRANIFLRTAERVLLKAGKFRAETFDELFEGVRALPWDIYLPSDGKFWVTKASSIKSKLFSPSDIQRIVKKAIVEKLKEAYHISWFQETGAMYPVRVFLLRDEALITLDTSGDSLHKRGYRTQAGMAPLFPYTTLFRSDGGQYGSWDEQGIYFPGVEKSDSYENLVWGSGGSAGSG